MKRTTGDDAHAAPALRPSPSSSVSESQSTSSESTVSSSQESHSTSTSIYSMSERAPSKLVSTRRELVMTPENHQQESVSSSTISAKQYKNSPFGLTGHYLTMPDGAESSESQSQHEADEESLEHRAELTVDPAQLSSSSKNYIRENWRKLNAALSNGSSSNELDLTSSHVRPNEASSSSGEPSSFGPTKPWLLDYKLQQAISSQPKAGSYANHVADCLPAGDGGLDARKCYARDMEKNCYPDEEGSSERLKSDNGFPASGSSSGLLVRFSSIMYATFLVILGCILHVSELRQKSKNSSDHIYTTVVALIGIFWLMFLQTDLQRYKRYASKYILIETIFNDHKQRQSADELAAFEPAPRSTSSSSASLVNDRMSLNTEVIFKKTAYKMYQRRAALDQRRNEPRPHGSHQQVRGARRAAAKLSHRHHDLYRSPKSNYCLPDSQPASQRDNLIPAYKFLHGKMGANFYLKCGMAAFCFGHVIHEGLRFGQQVYFFGDGNLHCRDSAALVAHLVTPLYSFYQLFMMFKYSNLVINRHKILARFGLMHIIGTSVTFWFRTILEEAFEDFVHKMDYFKANKPQYNLSLMSMIGNDSFHTPVAAALRGSPTFRSDASEMNSLAKAADNQTDSMAQSLLSLMSSPLSATITPQLVKHIPESYACAQNTLLTTKSMNALPYLYPFTIEYNLLLAATFLSLYFNIGKIGHAGDKKKGSVDCSPVYSRSYLGNKMHKPSSAISTGSNSHMESSDNSSGNRIIVRSSASHYDHEHYREKEMGEYKSNFVVNADCHSANKGLFCGFFVLLVTLVTIVIFFVTINKPTHIQLGIKINLIQEATLTSLILIVTLAGFKQVVKLNRNPYLKDKVTTDDVLMLIPLPFFFIHSLLSFRAETAAVTSGGITGFSSILLKSDYHQQIQDSLISSNGNLQSLLSKNNNNGNKTDMSTKTKLNLLSSKLNGTNNRFDDLVSRSNRSINNSTNNNDNVRNSLRIGTGSGGTNSSQIDHFKIITVALNIIVMIEVLVQTNFIIDGMRRCSESRYLRFKKPGRELITFAIILNITYWIVATFETKSIEQYKTEIEYYGPLPYMFISHTTLPVMLFYRYHSSVCLAEIWNRAYKSPKKR